MNTHNLLISSVFDAEYEFVERGLRFSMAAIGTFPVLTQASQWHWGWLLAAVYLFTTALTCWDPIAVMLNKCRELWTSGLLQQLKTACLRLLPARKISSKSVYYPRPLPGRSLGFNS